MKSSFSLPDINEQEVQDAQRKMGVIQSHFHGFSPIGHEAEFIQSDVAILRARSGADDVFFGDIFRAVREGMTQQTPVTFDNSHMHLVDGDSDDDRWHRLMQRIYWRVQPDGDKEARQERRLRREARSFDENGNRIPFVFEVTLTPDQIQDACRERVIDMLKGIRTLADKVELIRSYREESVRVRADLTSLLKKFDGVSPEDTPVINVYDIAHSVQNAHAYVLPYVQALHTLLERFQETVLQCDTAFDVSRDYLDPLSRQASLKLMHYRQRLFRIDESLQELLSKCGIKKDDCSAFVATLRDGISSKDGNIEEILQVMRGYFEKHGKDVS